jgi:hypothetical protein
MTESDILIKALASSTVLLDMFASVCDDCDPDELDNLLCFQGDFTAEDFVHEIKNVICANYKIPEVAEQIELDDIEVMNEFYETIN